MAWNMPSYNTDNYTFGPCIVYIGATGTTPLTDIGAVKGNTEVTVNKEILEISQGSPRIVTKQYVTVQGAMVKFESLEPFKIANLTAALGAGVTLTDGDTEYLGYGGDVNMSEKAIRLVHKMPNGTTITLCFWRCQGQADLSIPFNESGDMSIPMEFKVLDGILDFAGATIVSTSCERLFRLIKENGSGASACDALSV